METKVFITVITKFYYYFLFLT